ncbi:6639_t:CDS:1, partial [Ambispora gerdemannii]
MSKIINKKLVTKEIEKIDVFTTSSSPSIPSTNNNNNDLSESEVLNKAKKIELFRENSLGKNKIKQPTEYEKNLQQLLTTNFDESINDQIGRTLTLIIFIRSNR